MATGSEILAMLCNGVEYTIHGNDYDSIIWHGKSPAITQAQFESGFAQFETWKIEQESAKIGAKESAEAKLAALGLTIDDLKALGL